jgi:hypothetical protein
MMSLFPRHTYVGYTATPFANVLIDPNYDPSRPADLYPKDFIYSLPAPIGYFGTERLFGRDLLDAEVELSQDEELDMVRTIPSDELAHLKPSKEDPDFVITDSLNKAINYFLIANAIRDARGQRHQHSTMLVHTSHLKDDHRLVASVIEESLKAKQKLLRNGSPTLLAELRQLFEEESAKVPASVFGHPTHDFDDLTPMVAEAAESTQVVIENSESDDRLDYDGATAGTGRRYLCIGGNVISRGLTLEGLVSTFFMRTSKQYDTLMQMGRWFGYRAGYEDLPRVWMTAAMQDNFRSLATVEADLREMIRVYEQEDHQITPMDIPVRIRQVPGLAVTARNKMHSARQVKISFGGTHRQTTHFAHRNPDILRQNWAAAEKLLSAAEAEVGIDTTPRGNGLLARAVPRSIIEQFLHEYSIHPTHAELFDEKTGHNHLLEYISKRKEYDPEELSYWNVGVIGPGTAGPTATIRGHEISLIKRARIDPLLENGDADIKALMSRSDALFDVPGVTAGKSSWEQLKKLREQELGYNVPLLLLYPIDRKSEPRKTPGPRRPLDAVSDVMGMGIIFPGTNEATGYIEVDMTPESEDDLNELGNAGTDE